MSKITPKNLSYDSTLPPFLARLQANNSSRDDRHEFSVARPKKLRSAEDEAEDEPLYFNEESGETLTKREWEVREAGKKEETAKDVEKGSEDAASKGEELKDGKGKKDEKVAGIGAGKKRKVGKLVGAGEEEEPVLEKKPSQPEGKKGEQGKPKKKAKKIKLSFGDEE